uniref:Uncharacterized protein n=1 Tax=Arundo donax TaxID=35708 RepID=A0A0A9EBN2_ARUDO
MLGRGRTLALPVREVPFRLRWLRRGGGGGGLAGSGGGGVEPPGARGPRVRSYRGGHRRRRRREPGGSAARALAAALRGARARSARPLQARAQAVPPLLPVGRRVRRLHSHHHDLPQDGSNPRQGEAVRVHGCADPGNGQGGGPVHGLLQDCHSVICCGR